MYQVFSLKIKILILGKWGKSQGISSVGKSGNYVYAKVTGDKENSSMQQNNVFWQFVSVHAVCTNSTVCVSDHVSHGVCTRHRARDCGQPAVHDGDRQ